MCDTESEEFSRLDYTKNDAACANYTAPANMVRVQSSVSCIISYLLIFILCKNLTHCYRFQAAVMICDHFCTEIDYDFLRVYNDADGSLLGTYHGGHCLRNSILIYHQLIVVSRSGRISADWSGNGGTTRTGFLFCSFTPCTINKNSLIAINKDSLSIVVTMHIFNILHVLLFKILVQQADAPVGHDNSMFNGYWDPGNYNLFMVWNFYRNC